MKAPTPKFKQISIAQQRGDGGGNLTYTVFALSEDGKVYKFEKKNGWVLLDTPNSVSSSKSSRSSVDDDDISF